MRYKVLDTFATPLHRFAAGMEVEDHEIDGDVSAKRWVELKKLEAMTVKPLAPDLASDQATLKAAWERRGEPWVEGDPIFISDHALYGTIKSDPEAAVVDVLVFSEDFTRRYPQSAVDALLRSAAGEFTEERATKTAQAAVVAAARERAAVAPPPVVVTEPERVPSA